MDQRLNDEELAAVLAPVATANGLPNRHYVDPAWFDIEKERLFFDGWAGIGFAKDVPAPGDAKPLTFLGQPLVIIRGRDGQLRVFFNTCRHRGMILVKEAGPIRGAIRCPYHSWCYDLDGALKATPHVGGPGHNAHEAIDRATLGLVEVRSHVWRDVVFVNISGDAPPFEEAHAAARDIGLCVLSHLKAELGELSRITGWARVFGMVASAPGFTQQHLVINGFSDLIIEVFGPDAGRHARSAIGVSALPMNFAMEIEGEVLIG